MKNTFLIGSLFLMVGLIGGQFLDLRIKNQEGTILKAPAVEDLKDLKPIKDYSIIEIPDGHRQYYCTNGAFSIFIEANAGNSGTIVYNGLTLGCTAVTGNIA